MENWKSIDGYEGLYTCSDSGQVKALARMISRRRKNDYHSYWKDEKLMSPAPHDKGYLKIKLLKKGEAKSFFIHRIIAVAFIPNPENKPQVNHINGIKADNRIENLEWCTASDNLKHAYNTGLQPKDRNIKRISDSPNAIPVYQYDMSGNLIRQWGSLFEAHLTGLYNKSGISECCSGKRSHHKNYKWTLRQTQIDL